MFLKDSSFVVHSNSQLGFFLRTHVCLCVDGFGNPHIPFQKENLKGVLKTFLNTNERQVDAILSSIEMEPEKFIEASAANITMRVDSFEVGKPNSQILPVTPKEVIAKKELSDQAIARVNKEIEQSWNGKFSLVQNVGNSLREHFGKYGWKIVGVGNEKYEFWPKEK